MRRFGLRFIGLVLLLTGSTMALADQQNRPILLLAKQMFDGENFINDAAILVAGGHISATGPLALASSTAAEVIDLGDATVLPGFIELHAHSRFQNVPAETILRHGVTTIRDVGGPVFPASGGDGSLRMMTSGPIITAPGGYPITTFGANTIGVPIATEEQAREAVRQLIANGAVVIKVALEPGAETGAPWTSHHEHGASKAAPAKKPWPLMSESVVKAIVDEANRYQRKVTAHIGEKNGARIALNAGITEWAHMPCAHIPDTLLQKAFAQQVKIVSTLDTLSKCPGISGNASRWAALGGELLYGAEIAHPDIPWGIDAQELFYMMRLADMTLVEVLRSATSKAGSLLGIPLLGTLATGAPADIIAVKGSLNKAVKKLEYPDFVMSGGKRVVNSFAN
ncbi:MAG: amidohydrolase [Methylobacter sp.]|nr:MAG: amidohydrolase [Methylobacter sp.]